MSDNNNNVQDPIIGTKGTTEAVSNAKSFMEGTGKRLTIRLNLEQAQLLYTELSKYKDNERGVKLDIHTGMKTSQAGTTFPSSFFFLNKIGEPAAFGGVSKTKFVPKKVQQASK